VSGCERRLKRNGFIRACKNTALLPVQLLSSVWERRSRRAELQNRIYAMKRPQSEQHMDHMGQDMDQDTDQGQGFDENMDRHVDEDFDPDMDRNKADMTAFDRRCMSHGAKTHSVPMMEARLAYIKADLEITDAQMSAWDAYADTVRARHDTMESVDADIMKAEESSSALERMEARLKAMESIIDSLKALKQPTKALYAVLTEQQKKKADQCWEAEEKCERASLQMRGTNAPTRLSTRHRA